MTSNKVFKKINIFLLLTYLTIALTIIISIIIYRNPEWLRTSISHLGIDPNTQRFFNAGIILSSIFLLVVVNNFSKIIKSLLETNVIKKKQAYFLYTFFYILVACLIVFAIFFADWITLFLSQMHNSAGITLTIVFFILYFSISKLIPVSIGFKKLSLIFANLTIFLFFIHFVLKLIAFTAFESILFITWGTWAYLFFRDITKYHRNIEILEVNNRDDRIVKIKAIITILLYFVLVYILNILLNLNGFVSYVNRYILFRTNGV